MTKRYLLFIAIICTLLSKQSFLKAGSFQKLQDFYHYQSILPSEISGSNNKVLNGGFHKLTGNATSHGNSDGCIRINNDQTILDLNGACIVASGANGVAIKVAANVKSVTIRNGTILSSGANYFGEAIYIGDGATDIVIEDIKIVGCLSPNGAIALVGTDINNIKNVTLNNVTVTGGIGTISSINSHVKAAFVQGLYLNNVISRGGKTDHTFVNDPFFAIYIQNCHSVVGKNISSTNHGPGDSTIGLAIFHSSSIKIDELYLSKNAGSSDYRGQALYCDGCKNAVFNDITIDGLTDMSNAVEIKLSYNIILNNMMISNCSISAGSSPFYGIYILDSTSVKTTNTSITNNSGYGEATTSVSSDGFTGILARTSTDIIIDNVEIKANSCTAGDCNGIILDSANLISISNTTIARNICNPSTAGFLCHARGIYTRTNPQNLYIQNCKIIGNAHNGTHTSSTTCGIYLQSVPGCIIENTTCSQNNGAAQAFGFYVESVEGLIMENCIAKGNAAGISGSGNTGGIASKPSAGLYLYASSGAYIKDCKFINNKAGNRNPGLGTAVTSGTATSTIGVATCCGGFGLANVGTSTSNLNIGNTFINCIFKRNGTQIDNTTLTDNNVTSTTAPQYQGTTDTRRCWESEALEAGAIEENTNSSLYTNCIFKTNGLSKFVTSYGLCISNGTPSVVQAPQLTDCKFLSNGFYGVFDNNPTTVINATGCIAVNNGNTNTVASSLNTNETLRNWNLGSGSSVYISLASNDKSTAGAYGPLANFNFTSISAA